MTVIKNENSDLIPTRIVIEWHMCIDYMKLNKATKKDHFFLAFIDQMLKRFVKNPYFGYLDGDLNFF